jgi:intracellular multiplication protein IcmC
MMQAKSKLPQSYFWRPWLPTPLWPSLRGRVATVAIQFFLQLAKAFGLPQPLRGFAMTAKGNVRNTATTKLTIVFLLISFFITSPAHAQTIPDIATMLENLTAAVPDLTRLTTAIAYVMGIFFVVRGVMDFKRLGEQRTMMSGEHTWKGPIISIGVGALLLYLPSTVQSGFMTFWTEPNPYQYEKLDSSDPWNELIIACFQIIQLIGIIAFIRGVLDLAKLGQGQQQHGLAKALAYIIAGIFLIDLWDFVSSVLTTLGLNMI